MKKRTSLTLEEIIRKYQDQILLLIKRCNDFDSGDIIEASSISVILRTLLHDNPKNNMAESLLSQLNKKFEFLSSISIVNDQDNSVNAQSFLTLSLVGSRVHNWQPIFDNPQSKPLSFLNWWSNEVILIDSNSNSFTREDIVKTFANQDGGAHQDKSIETNFYNLTRKNSMQLRKEINNKWENIDSPVPYIIRQIAHEVLRSQNIKGYQPNINFYEGLAISISVK